MSDRLDEARSLVQQQRQKRHRKRILLTIAAGVFLIGLTIVSFFVRSNAVKSAAGKYSGDYYSLDAIHFIYDSSETVGDEMFKGVYDGYSGILKHVSRSRRYFVIATEGILSEEDIPSEESILIEDGKLIKDGKVYVLSKSSTDGLRVGDEVRFYGRCDGIRDGVVMFSYAVVKE